MHVLIDYKAKLSELQIPLPPPKRCHTPYHCEKRPICYTVWLSNNLKFCEYIINRISNLITPQTWPFPNLWYGLYIPFIILIVSITIRLDRLTGLMILVMNDIFIINEYQYDINLTLKAYYSDWSVKFGYLDQKPEFKGLDKV